MYHFGQAMMGMRDVRSQRDTALALLKDGSLVASFLNECVEDGMGAWRRVDSVIRWISWPGRRMVYCRLKVQLLAASVENVLSLCYAKLDLPRS